MLNTFFVFSARWHFASSITIWLKTTFIFPLLTKSISNERVLFSDKSYFAESKILVSIVTAKGYFIFIFHLHKLYRLSSNSIISYPELFFYRYQRNRKTPFQHLHWNGVPFCIREHISRRNRHWKSRCSSNTCLSRVSKKDEPSSEYCGVVNFCKNCLLRNFAFLDSLLQELTLPIFLIFLHYHYT